MIWPWEVAQAPTCTATDSARVACERCDDTGMFEWNKPMSGPRGEMYLVFVPQCCWCEVGLKLFPQQCAPTAAAVQRAMDANKPT
jgi:hypothetical protein